MEGLGPGLGEGPEGLGGGGGEGRRHGKQPVKGGREGFGGGEARGRLRFWRGTEGFRVEWRGQGREDVTGSEGPRGRDGARGVGRVVGGVG